MNRRIARLQKRSRLTALLCVVLAVALVLWRWRPDAFMQNGRPDLPDDSRHLELEHKHLRSQPQELSPLQFPELGSAGTPATLGLMAVLLGLVAFQGGKALSAATLALLSGVLAVLSAWALIAPEAADAPRDSIELNDQDWAEVGVEELKDAGDETRRRKRDIVKSWIKWAVYGGENGQRDGETGEVNGQKPQRAEGQVSESSRASATGEREQEVLSAGDADLMVKVSSSMKEAEPKSKADGVRVLMAQPLGDVLAAMGQDGWEVRPRDAERGLYELFLPAVEYDLGMGSVSIPSPHFLATLKESNASHATAGKRERCTANLALQNGNGILTVKLGFPFSTTLSLSAAGEVTAYLGQVADSVYLQGDVELGVWLPKVPGLNKIMRTFVKSYANQSLAECATALANRADEITKREDVNQKSAAAVAVAAAAVAASEMGEVTTGLVKVLGGL
eukprot:TRINITY_DN42632_c0_g1_i1.p1 TRINITY_DN42632_c0_g1~~TRINITY_DN42632_c0_g1_i1.p1  ORF type:complete len:476 (-),score=107.03 TRINITY_DN42632_c0_g1_i1:131-1480(-)